MLHLLLFPLCLAASGVLAYSAVRALGRGSRRAGARLLGWSLLPLGAYFVGLVTLVSRIGGAITRWVANLVFNPLTWIGFVMLAVGVLLVVVTGPFGRRPSSAVAKQAELQRRAAPQLAPRSKTAPAEPVDARTVLRERGLI
jgi:hypothetical protein